MPGWELVSRRLLMAAVEYCKLLTVLRSMWMCRLPYFVHGDVNVVTFIHFLSLSDPAVVDGRGHAHARPAEHHLLLGRGQGQEGLQTLRQLPKSATQFGKWWKWLQLFGTASRIMCSPLGLQVLINEEEVVSEGLRGRPPPAVTPGDKAFQKHFCEWTCYFIVILELKLITFASTALWESYLAPADVDPNRKR